MKVVITEAERTLIIELAVATARHLSFQLEPYIDDDSALMGYVQHGHMSHTEDGCEALWRLGVAKAAFYSGAVEGLNVPYHSLSYKDYENMPKGIGEPEYFKFLTEDEIRTFLSDAPLDRLNILTWIIFGYVSNVVDREFSFTSDTFRSTPSHHPEIDALIANGYLEHIDYELFFWTEKIAIALRNASLLEEKYFSPTKAIADKID